MDIWLHINALLKGGSCCSECNYNRRASALDVCSYEQQWHGPGATRRGSHVAATPRAVQQAAVEYAAQLSPEATDDEEKAELELTLAVGTAGAKKRYSNEHGSPRESFSSSSTESDTLTGGREWQAHNQNQMVGTGSPYHKRRPARFEVVQVEDGAVQQPSAPLLFHWLSLRMA